MVSVAAPITPVHRPTMSGRSPESDSDELSPAQDFGFDYVYDDEGRLAPVPRGTQAVRSPSPSPSRPPPEDNLRRASGDAQIKDSRTFQRVSSGPALNNFPKMPRRVTMEDPAAAPDLEQEKENFRNIAVVPKRVSAAASLGGGGRIMRSGEQPRAPLAYTRGVAKLGMLNTNARVGRISEGDQRSDSEGIDLGDTEVVAVPQEVPPRRVAPLPGALVRQRTYGGASRRSESEEGSADSGLSSSGNSRPRRSASVSDVIVETAEAHRQVEPSYEPSNRPLSGVGIPRSASDEPELRNYRSSRPQYISRHSPSPPHPQVHATPPQAPTHRRRDSDTLRSFATSVGGTTSVNGNTAASTSYSPTVQPNKEPVASKLSPSARSLAHRRSPTGTSISAPVSADEDSPSVANKARRLNKSSGSASSISGADAQALMVGGGSQTIWVNRKAYARLGMIGKGGSSRVFRVMNIANDLYAVKRVSLDKVDADTLNGYMNEIALLKRLEGNSRIIRLYDSEVRPGPGGSKGHLVLVMECGEVDFAKLLAEQQKEPLNVVWVSYYWQQMLQAVQVIHDEKIVHSDLKPANFVVVRGQLKLIDFGIANAIANDTTNIHRDHQIGTVNYMSPEAIEPDAIRRIKVGRPSDVWSLGCILYQMVYGSPPFSHLNVMQKMRAIPNPDYQIEFPEFATPSIPKGEKVPEGSGEAGPAAPQKLEHLKRPVRRDVIENIKQCLKRVPKERATIPKLLEQQWIALNNGPESATATPEQPFTSKQPTIQDLLAPDQTVITPHYMKQLLCYAQSLNITDDNDPRLDIEAKKLVEELRQVQL